MGLSFTVCEIVTLDSHAINKYFAHKILIYKCKDTNFSLVHQMVDHLLVYHKFHFKFLLLF